MTYMVRGIPPSQKKSYLQGQLQLSECHAKENHMTTTTIHTKGMSCHHCEERVCNAVKNEKGVHDCTADATTGNVVVTHDDNLDIAEIENLIDDIGYEVVK